MRNASEGLGMIMKGKPDGLRRVSAGGQAHGREATWRPGSKSQEQRENRELTLQGLGLSRLWDCQPQSHIKTKRLSRGGLADCMAAVQ